jgi:hypothetical protein
MSDPSTFEHIFSDGDRIADFLFADFFGSNLCPIFPKLNDQCS